MNIDPRPRSDIKFVAGAKSDICHCEFCKNNKSFDAPSELIDLFLDGRIVLFAGAGISTEANDAMPISLYDQVRHILGAENGTRPFPDLMQEYCLTPSGRTGLIQRIQDHFSYAYAHESIYRRSTRFHRELATFFPLDTIVTTNWDTYFEDHCAATPFIEDRDLAFWEVAKRKVLKIHGSITNFGSVVATRSDYDLCKTRLQNGIIGAHLKSLLATRTVVFIGYSLKDDDFLQLYDTVRQALNDFHRQAYFVAPHIGDDDRSRLRALNLHLIETDGTFFVSQLKSHAAATRCIAADTMYDDVGRLLADVNEAHDWLHGKYTADKHPQILYCSWYQDGLMHGLERILRLRRTGMYSDLHQSQHLAHAYFNYAKRYRKKKYFGDSAYCYGFSNAFVYAAFTSEERRKHRPPLFFYFDSEIYSASEYRRRLNSLPDLHKTAFKQAQDTVRRHPYLSTHVLHHLDQLDLSVVDD